MPEKYFPSERKFGQYSKNLLKKFLEEYEVVLGNFIAASTIFV